MTTLQIQDSPDPADIRCVERELGRYNESFAPYSEQRFAVFARDDTGRIVGGLIATIAWEWCYIETVWLAEELRGHGTGHALLEAGEQHAMDLGVDRVYLWTASFQAPRFYLDHGYEFFGKLEDCPPGHTKFYMHKKLKR